MDQKQIMKVKSTVNERIVKIASSHYSFVDSHFFHEHMGEYDDLSNKNDKGYKNYTVQVKAISINWLIHHEGLSFLKAIIRHGDVEIFKIDTVEMIVEYLFQNFKTKLLIQSVPIFLI